MKKIAILIFVCFSFFIGEYSSGKQTKRLVQKVFEDGLKRVIVLDNWISKSLLRNMHSLASYGDITGMMSAWSFAVPDEYQKIRKPNSTNNIAWVSPVNPQFFMSTKLWKAVQKAANKLSGGKDYVAYDVTLSMIKRLDFITRDTAYDTSSDDLVVRIFLNSDLKKNDYGEAVYYKDDGEILAALYPSPGRIVLWNASIPYMYKPPAMSFPQQLYDVTIKLTTSEHKVKEFESRRKEDAQITKKDSFRDFPLSDGATRPLPKFDFAKHEKKRFHDSQGREVVMFDGLMSKEDLNALRLYLLQYNSAYAHQPYDSDATEDHDNVSWIAGLKVEPFIKSRLWQLVKEVVTYLSGKDEWFPYDVSMNIIRSAHHTRIHEDCEDNEYEYTFLMYLNPEWDADKYGETSFFELRKPPNGGEVVKGKEEYDWIGSVSPRYGRIAVFRGIIPHSARPPSPDVKGARYTFACKVGRNYRIARAKTLRETIENVEPGDPDYQLVEDLTMGLYDHPSPDRPLEFIETTLENRQKKKEQRVQEDKMNIVRALTAKRA